MIVGGADGRPRSIDEAFEWAGYRPAVDERDEQLADVTAERDELAAVLAVLLDLVSSLLADVPDRPFPTTGDRS